MKPKYLDEILPELEDDTKEMYLLLSGNVNRDKTDADRAFDRRAWKKDHRGLQKKGHQDFPCAGNSERR